MKFNTYALYKGVGKAWPTSCIKLSSWWNENTRPAADGVEAPFLRFCC